MQTMQVLETFLISVKPGAAAAIKDSMGRTSIDLEALTGRVGSPNGTAAGSMAQINVSMQGMLDDGPGTGAITVNIQDSSDNITFADENSFSLLENSFKRLNLTGTTKRYVRFTGANNGTKAVPVLVTLLMPGTKA